MEEITGTLQFQYIKRSDYVDGYIAGHFGTNEYVLVRHSGGDTIGITHIALESAEDWLFEAADGADFSCGPYYLSYFGESEKFLTTSLYKIGLLLDKSVLN